jgi:hypothetical protein
MLRKLDFESDISAEFSAAQTQWREGGQTPDTSVSPYNGLANESFSPDSFSMPYIRNEAFESDQVGLIQQLLCSDLCSIPDSRLGFVKEVFLR